MRTRHWFSNLLGGLLVTAGAGSALADGPGGGYAADPGYSGVYNSPYAAPYQPAPYGAPGAYPAGYPTGMNAYPGISPFAGPPVEAYQAENGFWFNDSKFGGRRHYANVQGMYGRYSDPKNTRIGSPGIFPLRRTATTIAGTDITTLPNATVAPFKSIGDLEGPAAAGGMKLTYGFWNPDETGLEISGFFLDEGRKSLDLKSRPESISAVLDPNDPALIYPPGTFFNQVLAGVPLSQGIDGPLGDLTEQVQKYDRVFSVEHTSMAWGAHADWYFNPWYEKSQVRLRPSAGMRYMGIKENFRFRGVDSGVNYFIATRDLAINTVTGRPLPTAVEVQELAENPIPGGAPVPAGPLETNVRSWVNTQLAGPEIGMRLDLGNDERFLLWSHTKFGLLANHSKRRIQGSGLVNQTFPNIGPAPGTDTSFLDSDTNNHVSPMFEQSFQGKAAILQFVPYVNKMRAFETAQFTAGYTITVVGEVYRPADNIIYRSFPDLPTVGDDRSAFATSAFNFGIEWEY